jgi:phytoene/squalene synthetase
MEKQQLRDQLAALHAALRDADAVDPEARAMLQQVMDDIRGALERAERSGKHESLTERLRDAVGRFEGTHPALTEAAGRVIDTLASLGI